MTWFKPKIAELLRGRKKRESPQRPNPTATRSAAPDVVTAVAPQVRLRDQAPSQGHDFGNNPGNLRMLEFVPEGLEAGAALVVVLHGCGLSASDYSRGTGWATLASQHGFALVFPEQSTRNNPMMCFNWFNAGDVHRGKGEAQSISQMVTRMVAAHGIDPCRVFVTGLSAGGAMSAVMLSSYPEVFAAGAIIAGLPFGAASSMSGAMFAMSSAPDRSREYWGGLVRDAGNHDGPWPRVSIWHGSGDRTVSPGNASALERQWLDLHDLDDSALTLENQPGHTRRTWHNRSGIALIESTMIEDMDHGVPINPRGEDGPGCGAPGSYFFDVGLSSTHHIAQSWGLTGDAQVALSGQAVETKRRWLS